MKALTKEEKFLHDGSHYDNPCVYVGTYHKYNCGSLDGMWVDLTTFDSYEDFIEFCKRLHCDESDPEFMAQEYAEFPYKYYTEGFMSKKEFDSIIEWHNLDEDDRSKCEEYWDEVCEDTSIEDILGSFCYEGSIEDYAEVVCEECGDLANLPDWLRYCIDWKLAGRTIQEDYHVTTNYIFSAV